MMKICLDPGHGGFDPGAVGLAGTKEKDIALVLAKKVAALLRPAYEVKLTRETDVHFDKTESVDQIKRAMFSNGWGADLFVSIHCNGSKEDKSANGAEIYSCPGSDKGMELAGSIINLLPSALAIRNRGAKVSGFSVLKNTDCPAVLVEVAFISNEHEEQLLKTVDFQDRAAWAIATGIASYCGTPLCRPVQAADNVKVTARGKTVVTGRRISGQVWVPVRDILSALGFSVKWDEKNQEVTIDG